MWFKTPSRSEEYELVDQIPMNTDLEGQASGNEIEDSSKNSSESSSSVIFEDIDDYSRKNNGGDDFHDNTTFQKALQQYRGKRTFTKKSCGLMITGFVILWIIAIVAYSQGAALSIVSDMRWKTNITVSGNNVTLNSYDPERNNLTLELQRAGTFAPYRNAVNWLNIKQRPTHTKTGGFYLSNGPKGSYVIRQVNSEQFTTVIENSQFSYRNNFFNIQELKMNPGKPVEQMNDNLHIVVTDILPQWRHSSFALYWLYNPVSSGYVPLQPPGLDEHVSAHDDAVEPERLRKLHFAEFSPSGDFIIFGFNHDLYIQDTESNEITQITDNGSADIFNGKPDWIYEEEVVADYKLFWWSPDQKNIMYASLDDSKVHEYDLDYYVKDTDEIGDTYQESVEKKVDGVNQYPTKKSIKYPKPGTPNPKVSIYNFNLSTKKNTKLNIKDSKIGDDYILYDAIWLDDDNFLMKLTDRTSKILTKKLFQPSKFNDILNVNNLNVTHEYNGWVDKTSAIAIMPSEDSENSYIDKIVVNNRTHLALYQNPKSPEPSRILTDSPEWEVISDSPVVYDKIEDIVYCLSTIRSSMDAHLIAINLSEKIDNIRVITDLNNDGVFEIDFSDDGQYLNLIYNGPNNPWQKLINMADIHNIIKPRNKKDKEYAITDLIKNTKPINYVGFIEESLKKTNLPTRLYKKIKIDDLELNVIEILPPNFDPNCRKYPLLVHAYGGPGSQTVDKRFNIDFQDVTSASMDAVVLIIDPRGTGGQGWRFKSFASGKIGYWEARDLTTVVSEYINVNRKFINEEKTALWGWSYGGFSTLKTLEFDKGETFKFGMAVAPVTNWLFYDSIYTERYMNLPSENENYEKLSLIKEFDNYKSVKRLLLMHGTADDNVHLQNSLWLLDKFNIHGLENYDVHFFPDNDHSIFYHNSNRIVYDKLLGWLFDAFNGKFDDFK